MGVGKEASITLPSEVYEKIMWWINHADGEVSGMGTVTWDEEENTFRIDDAILLKQKCTSATTELEAGAVAQAEFELRGHKGEGLRWWWHSHVNMNVFWSGTDTATIAELGEHGWFVSTVFNKKEESKSCIYQGKPFPIFQDDIQLFVEYPPPPVDPRVAAWEADFEAKVDDKPPVYQGGYNRNWNTAFNRWSREDSFASWNNTTQSWDEPAKDKDSKKNTGQGVDSAERTEGLKLLDKRNELETLWYNMNTRTSMADDILDELGEIEDKLDVYIDKNLLTDEEVYCRAIPE